MLSETSGVRTAWSRYARMPEHGRTCCLFFFPCQKKNFWLGFSHGVITPLPSLDVGSDWRSWVSLPSHGPTHRKTPLQRGFFRLGPSPVHLFRRPFPAPHVCRGIFDTPSDVKRRDTRQLHHDAARRRRGPLHDQREATTGRPPAVQNKKTATVSAKASERQSAVKDASGASDDPEAFWTGRASG